MVDGDRFGPAVDFHGGHGFRVAKGAVRACPVVELEEGFQVGVGFDLGAVALQVNLLVFDRPPEPFDEDVVEAAALAIHRELYSELEQRLGKLRRGKLAALVGVDDVRNPVLGDRPLHCIRTEGRVQRVRQLPGEDGTAVPVDHRAQVDEPALDRHVGDVGGEDLIWPAYFKFRSRYLKRQGTKRCKGQGRPPRAGTG